MNLPITTPRPLHPGSRVAVTAVSSGVPAPLHPRLDLALSHLRAQGYVVEEGACLRAQSAGASAPAAARAAELMHFLLRDDIDAVIPPWGGELAIELLPRLDWRALCRVRQKWLLGYSDTSTLLLPVTLQLGWMTAHGPGLMDLVPGQDDSLTRGALPSLSTPAGGTFAQTQSSRWQRDWGDFAASPGVTYGLTEATRWQALGGDTVVQMEGRLLGGCLDTLIHLVGTPWGDVPRFATEHGPSDGVVLFLENAEMKPEAVVRALTGLRAARWLDGISGLLIGRSSGPEPADRAAGADAEHASNAGGSDPLSQRGALTSVLADLPCPVLIDVDIGHRPPQLLLINGAGAVVQWSDAEGGQVDQTLA